MAKTAPPAPTSTTPAPSPGKGWPLSHRLVDALDLFFTRIQVLPWVGAEARAYGTLRARQQATGKTLECMDMLIAAHAIAIGAVLVSSDQAFRAMKVISP